ncbi:MAG: PIN/TRAM domain-containing protein [Phycisphaerae bacterium]
MILHFVRLIFVLAVLTISLSFAVESGIRDQGVVTVTLYVLVPTLAALLMVTIDTFWERKRLHVISGLFFGLLAGLAIAFFIGLIVDAVVMLFPGPAAVERPGLRPQQAQFEQEVPPPPVDPRTETQPGEPVTQADIQAYKQEVKERRDARLRAVRQFLRAREAYDRQMNAYLEYSAYVRTVQLIKLVLGACAIFICVTFIMQTKDEFRFLIPYVEFSRERKGSRPFLLDTSVIIDGRIADIAETRILESEIIVPRFILAELQAIADSDDKLKRNRGRRGLDVLNRLQGDEFLDIRLMDTHVPSVTSVSEVDAKLVALAEHMDGRVVTNDFNLNKIAQLRGVEVININDLANALKPVVLPGESMRVKVIKPGEESGQGVGYLEDGTMVVAEQARDCIGREIAITVTSVLQTSAGRMIFGKLDPDRTFGGAKRSQ